MSWSEGFRAAGCRGESGILGAPRAPAPAAPRSRPRPGSITDTSFFGAFVVSFDVSSCMQNVLGKISVYGYYRLLHKQSEFNLIF